jgi:hypothetical protein
MPGMTKQDFEEIMTRLVKEVVFYPMLCSGHAEPLHGQDEGKYRIHINSYNNELQRETTLVHEVEHIRRGKGIPEDEIEAEAVNFLKKYPEVVERFYKKYYVQDSWRKPDEWIRERGKFIRKILS